MPKDNCLKIFNGTPLKLLHLKQELRALSVTSQLSGSVWVGITFVALCSVPTHAIAVGVFFMEIYWQLIKFKTKRSYVEAFNAPQSYADSEDTRITTYDALKADINNSNYTTYYEYENDENEAKRDIVVLSYISWNMQSWDICVLV